MTERKDLLHPLEPAQRLAEADRDALDSLLAAVADCKSLIATERTALQQATNCQQETLQACVDAVGRLSEEICAAGRDDAALTEAVRQVPAAVAGLSERLDETGAQHASSIRLDIAALGGALERIAEVQENQDRRLLAVTDSMSAVSAAVAALREEAHGVSARQAQTNRTRTIADLVKGTASPGVRTGNFERVPERHRSGVRLHAIAFSLLLAVVYGAGLMTDLMLRFFDGSAGMAVPPATELLPWPLPDASPE